MSPTTSMSNVLFLRRSLIAASSTRSLHTSRPTHASVLFALGALSNSRETQHFSKKSKLSRVEHSPPLELIRSSEVDPFIKAGVVDKTATIGAGRVKQEVRRDVLSARDGAAAATTPITGIGMNVDTSAFDARLATATQELSARLERAGKDIADLERGLSALQREVGTLVKTVGLLICLIVGGVSGVAMWRFWPQEKSAAAGTDLGKKLADRTRAAMPLPAARSARREMGTQTAGTSAGPAAMMGEAAVLPVAVSGVDVAPIVPVAKSEQEEWRWWKNLFWKQR